MRNETQLSQPPASPSPSTPPSTPPEPLEGSTFLKDRFIVAMVVCALIVGAAVLFEALL